MSDQGQLLDEEAYAGYRRAIRDARSFDREMEDLSASRAPIQTGPPEARDQIPAGSHDAAYVEDDPKFLEIFARTLKEVGNSVDTGGALLYRARLCSCPCHEIWANGTRLWKPGDPDDCPTGFCTHDGRLCAAEMNARLNHHGTAKGVVIVGGDPKTPACCGKTVLIGTGGAAGFQIEVWRCLNCGWHKSTSVRVDGKTFWVGAMGRAISNETLRIIANSYGGSPPVDPLP